MKANREGNSEPGTPRVYPSLCEPSLSIQAVNWGPDKRREVADKFERWNEQLRFSADFIERYEGKGETVPVNEGDAQLLELAARLDQQAAQIRRHLGLCRQPKREGKPELAFLAEN